jgi:hypothetical protein|nr:MAG TPA: hypothetical protein [Caudoviricetes sp.]DAX53314.1 MAG TPA: hypothetical protein [Caudoviricetes sp.]DAX94286.1 MAG TPA: hypothetical protein [Caudoviricetes sp.]
MSYKKLSDERKKNISINANNYAKDNYRQFTIRLSPDVANRFDDICKNENLSRPELIKKLIENY